MKKILSATLAVVLALSLAACSTLPISSEPSSGGLTAENGVVTEDSAQDDVAQPAEGVQPEQQDVSVPEIVLLDESGVKITATGLNLSGWAGPELELLIENNSGQNLTFQCWDSSINGYMVDNMMSVDVVNGKKANDSITFMNTELETCGIQEIADMEFSFHIFDTDTWDTYLDTEPIQIKTSIADTYQYQFDDSGELVYDANGCKIVVKGLLEDDSVLGPEILVYIENNNDQGIMVQTDDVSVNGFMTDSLFSSTVSAGKHAVDTITLSSSSLEDNGITSIDAVELSFNIIDDDTWSTIAETETIALTF